MATILADGNYGVQSRHDNNDYDYLTCQHTGGRKIDGVEPLKKQQTL